MRNSHVASRICKKDIWNGHLLRAFAKNAELYVASRICKDYGMICSRSLVDVYEITRRERP
jgi:hypothetical protein